MQARCDCIPNISGIGFAHAYAAPTQHALLLALDSSLAKDIRFCRTCKLRLTATAMGPTHSSHLAVRGALLCSALACCRCHSALAF